MRDLGEFTMTIRNYRVPSLNALLGTGHWMRFKHRREAQDAFLSALLAGAFTCSMRTISCASTLSIASDTRGYFLTTLRNSLASAALKKRSPRSRKRKR